MFIRKVRQWAMSNPNQHRCRSVRFELERLRLEDLGPLN